MSSPAPLPKPRRPFWRRPVVLIIAGALALGGIIDAFDGSEESAAATSAAADQRAEEITAEREARHEKLREEREQRAEERAEESREERERERQERERAREAAAPTSTPKPPPPPPARPTMSRAEVDTEVQDAVYIGTLDLQDIYYSSEANAISAGRAICGELDRGLTFYEVGFAMMTHGGYGAGDSGYIVGAAITAYCPQHSDQLER